jgi:hypothetical protein
MIPKKLAPAKAGVADFSDKIMRKERSKTPRCVATPAFSAGRRFVRGAQCGLRFAFRVAAHAQCSLLGGRLGLCRWE